MTAAQAIDRLLRVSLICALGAPLSLAAQDAARPSHDAAEDGAVRVDIGGYGSFRYEANFSGGPSSITLRRFVVTTDAHLGGRLQVYSELEYERLSEIEIERKASREAGGLRFEQEIEGTNGSEIAIEQAWAQFALADGLAIRFGAVLPPVGRFNLEHDDNLWNLPRRPLVDRGGGVLPAPSAWTEMGIGVTGEVFVGDDVRLDYHAYLLNGVELDFVIEDIVQTREPERSKLELEASVAPTAGAFDGSNRADALSGRVAVSPSLGSEFGFSGYRGNYVPPYIAADGAITTVGVDGRQRLGPVFLEGEFLHTSYGNIDGLLRAFAAAAGKQASASSEDETAELEAEIAIDVGGVSKRRYGFWLDAGWPIALREGLLGLESPTLIPVTRYERVWFSDDVEAFEFAGGEISTLTRGDREQERWSVGLAFRPLTSAVVHLTFERSRAVRGELIDPEGGARVVSALTLGVAFGF